MYAIYRVAQAGCPMEIPLGANAMRKIKSEPQ